VSLTSIIRGRKDIREGLRARLTRPALKLGEIKAPPLTANYGIVATAFDYLLRFRLQGLNKSAQASLWAAEQGVEMIGAEEFVYDLDSGRLSSSTRDRRRQKADAYIAEARELHRGYLKTGKLGDELLAVCLRLAYLDVALRVGPDRIDWKGLAKPDKRDITDLRALLALVDESAFKARSACLLNPTFGLASTLVGGADADLLIDDCLIDIKNTKDPHLDAGDFLQLIGYYLLNGYAGMSCSGKPVVYRINSLAIYFSRYGVLWKFPVEEVLPSNAAPETARWFFDAVCRTKALRTRCLKGFSGPFSKCLKGRAQTPKKEQG
jgi:hypothetical protein